ncbi:hypothetical protein [Streptomyces sp. NPDC002676]
MSALKKGGELTGPSPVGVSAVNTHDNHALKPMITGLQTKHDPYRGRNFKPRRLHVDKAYDILGWPPYGDGTARTPEWGRCTSRGQPG